ncbi:putative ABC transporter permease [Murimonas intestini]|uniref:putative ABC transporter permease n=1 Tax=Murimonas intestini TaxID=1337051 RepID=UPI000D6D28DA|nr:hypothetical protein [Murimonas intestini]MCR1839406.1 putative ABC transporter permease [Murimonas intestini]MCR1864701.1 putative ABC transporter permease [Murimonas intestini]MCR1882311.1 putative ABC transporter permease [Murimonas intestini]
MKSNFIKCGICGWCLENLWTGFLSFRRREMKLKSQSSLWMFPIYGMAAFIAPLFKWLKNYSIIIRGTCYTVFIFLAEFLTGSFLKKRGMCPWDYSDAKTNINGVIRLDYAPLWFGAGLLFEKLSRSGK